MRPAIAIFFLIVGGVLLAAMVSLRTTHPDPLPGEVPPPGPDTTSAAKPAPSPVPKSDPKAAADAQPKFDKVKAGAVRATLEIEGKGIMELELYPKAAPKTVAHITELANKNFWDALKVHRVDETVVQMGDPASKDAEVADFDLKSIGSHGSGKTVPLEVDAKLPNLQYTVGLARTSDPDSGDSQIYINLQDNPAFDYKYCIFGRVVKGTDIVGKIVKGDKIKHLQVY